VDEAVNMLYAHVLGNKMSIINTFNNIERDIALGNDNFLDSTDHCVQDFVRLYINNQKY